MITRGVSYYSQGTWTSRQRTLSLTEFKTKQNQCHHMPSIVDIKVSTKVFLKDRQRDQMSGIKGECIETLNHNHVAH